MVFYSCPVITVKSAKSPKTCCSFYINGFTVFMFMYAIEIIFPPQKKNREIKSQISSEIINFYYYNKNHNTVY